MKSLLHKASKCNEITRCYYQTSRSITSCSCLKATVTLLFPQVMKCEVCYVLKKDSQRKKLQKQIFIDLHEAGKVKQYLGLYFKRANTRLTCRCHLTVAISELFAIIMSDHSNLNFSYILSCKISSFKNNVKFVFPS